MNEELNSALRKIEELEARLEMTEAKCSALASENEMLRLENKTLVEKNEGTSVGTEELLAENMELKAKIGELSKALQKFHDRRPAGRKKHDATWTASYTAFVKDFEDGMSIMDIVEKGAISRRTAYRYKAYYDELKRGATEQ